ncbi:MAG: hypothetical protein LBQ11_01965 [Candidatus Nomurabacteria bacterium]|jgi:hypothetical protein|nr:hypothetical protein [Candidatus Nomurabacteria bacterium]
MNNNPFEPVMTDPNDGNPPMTDSAADDFTADDNDGAGGGTDDATTQTSVSIDGLSVLGGDDSTDDGETVTIKSSTIATDDGGSILTDDHAGDFLDDLATDDITSPDSNFDLPAEPADDNAPTTSSVSTDTKPEKPVKHVTISLLTIILFVLALAGIAGTVYFWMQNNKNADNASAFEATNLQLKDELKACSVADDTTAGQYDGLNDKIKDGEDTIESLTKDKAELNKKVADQTKQITDLTNQNADLTKKAADIDKLSTRVDEMLKVLDKAFSP